MMPRDPADAPHPADALARRVTGFFRKHAERYGLNEPSVEARYVLNWGGFVNASFTVTDGQKNYHLKLADDAEMQQRLARWKNFSPRLAEKYHAPRVLDWIALPRSPYAGLLVESLPGQPAELADQPRVLAGVLALLAQLHADRVLADALQSITGSLPTCGEAFLALYIDRFDQDLLVIADELPPFVPLSLLDWMMGETRELEGLARDLPAFQQPAAAPTHGDLWPSNILVTAGERFSIIDWDDLDLGDPALEYSILLGPLWYAGRYTLEQVFSLLPAEPAFRERFALCLRALVLDQVIDTLADWVEADFAPDYQAEVRQAKERAHREALERYQQLYA